MVIEPPIAGGAKADISQCNAGRSCADNGRSGLVWVATSGIRRRAQNLAPSLERMRCIATKKYCFLSLSKSVVEVADGVSPVGGHGNRGFLDYHCRGSIRQRVPAPDRLSA